MSRTRSVMRTTGHYNGPAEIVADGVSTPAEVALISQVKVFEGGTEGLADWSGTASGPGVVPDIHGGPHKIRIPSGATASIHLSNSNQMGGGGWSATIQGNDPCPF